ncbi:MAG: threonine aldolase, partial [Flavobacteriaceae bacterium]|nr:threonine aldolase [Flavobacteriaceae bacterium]
TAQQVIEAINPPDFYHSPLTKLVEVENTANRGGGSCWDFNELQKIRNVCDTNQLGFHLDGARLWNALVARNETAQEYGQVFDTISVCLSKGLGCPIGSVLIGDDVFMQNAIRIRKILGGGMRQVGYLAAAGLYALDNHLERLVDDHQKAKEIGAVLQSLPFIKKVVPVETNIVIFELAEREKEAKFLNHFAGKGIRLSGMGSGKLRMVTHLDYSDSMHDYFITVLRSARL